MRLILILCCSCEAKNSKPNQLKKQQLCSVHVTCLKQTWHLDSCLLFELKELYDKLDSLYKYRELTENIWQKAVDSPVGNMDSVCVHEWNVIHLC